MGRMRFEETRPGHDECYQRYVRAAKPGTALARAYELIKVCVLPNLGKAESGPTSPGWKLVSFSAPAVAAADYVVPDYSTVASSATGFSSPTVLPVFRSAIQQRNKPSHWHQNLSENFGKFSVYLGELRRETW